MFDKIQKKAKSKVGKKAMNKEFPEVFGKWGNVEYVQITATGRPDEPFILYYLINFGDLKVLSHEKDTVIML
jgi:hypothetical protein